MEKAKGPNRKDRNSCEATPFYKDIIKKPPKHIKYAFEVRSPFESFYNQDGYPYDVKHLAHH